MSDAGNEKDKSGKSRKMLLWGTGAVFSVVFICALSLKIYLATPLAASHLSRLLTSALRQPVRVAGLDMTGGTLRLKGVSLANPAEFPLGSLAAADSIAIAPRWGELLYGRRSFRLIALEGVRLDLRKNSRGVWNFSQLRQSFAGKKPAAVEMFIKECIVKNGAFQVNGRGVKGISLHVFNLATKGSKDSRLELAFEDAAENHYTIQGKARAGDDPALDLSLTAPSLSLKSFAGMLRLKNARLLEGGKGSLRVTAGLHGGRLRSAGSLEFSRLTLSSAGRTLPLACTLTVAAYYDLKSDEARLETLALTVDKLIRLQAAGTASDLKGERRFTLDADIGEVDLGQLAFLLPEQGKLAFGGKLGSTAIRLSGNGSRGVTSATGTFMLHDGFLARNGRLFFSGLEATLRLSRVETGVLANGRLSLRESRDKPLLEAIDAPFSMTFSPRMKPLKAAVPSLSARIMGIPLSGRLGFSAAAVEPVTASLRIPATAVATLNPLLDKLGLRFAAGTASLSLDGAGRGPQEFSAAATARLATLEGKKGNKTFAVKNGVIAAQLGRKNGRFAAAGNVQLGAMALDGKTADARFSYSLAEETAVLADGAFRLDGTTVSLARLTARMPAKEAGAATVRYPLALEIAGCEIRQGKVALTGLSGTLRGSYAAEPGGRWLEGTADVASGGVFWQGKPVGSAAARFAFSRSGGRGDFSGTLLGGALNGDIYFNPFAAAEGGTFNLGVREGRMAMAADVMPGRRGVALTDGLLDCTASGGYSRRDGLACRFTAKGKNIAVTGSGGKTLLAGGGISLAGEISGQKVSLNEAVLTAGEGVALRVKGEIRNAFSQQRQGSLFFSLPQTSVNNLIDPFVNVLPRFIQEATAAGSVAAEATVAVRDGKNLLDGELFFKGVRLEVESQKFSAADINGRLPFSLNFPGGTSGVTPGGVSFSRANYPQLLQQLRLLPAGGQSVTVGKVSFGPLALGALSLQVTAGNGVTMITSLSSSLFEGAVLGRGYFALRNGIDYRGDLLINGLSLTQLCNAMPRIKGYISGRVDGVVSLSVRGKSMKGLSGFIDLWAREGSGEKMLVSKEFLQRLSGKKLRGFFFRADRPFDQAEINAILDEGYLTFETLDISHTNILGIRDLSVSIAPSQNRIALDHLLNAIKEATVRGKAATGAGVPAEAPVEPEFKWQE
jgi:hypothetical protein